MIKVRIKLLTKTACIPMYMTDGASGADLQADIAISPTDISEERMEMLLNRGVDGNSRLIIPAFGRAYVPCGFAVAIPRGYEMQIRSRSGLAINHGIHVLNSPGTIDSDYRGEVGVILANATSGPFVVKHGDRIAQAVIARAPEASYLLTDDLFATERGAGGLGSTGV